MKILRGIEGENFKVCRIAKDYSDGALFLLTLKGYSFDDDYGMIGSFLRNYNTFILEDVDGDITKVGIIAFMELFEQGELSNIAFPTEEMMTLLRLCSNKDSDFVNTYLKLLALFPQRLRTINTHFQLKLYSGKLLETDIKDVDKYNLLLTKFQLLQWDSILEKVSD